MKREFLEKLKTIYPQLLHRRFGQEPSAYSGLFRYSEMAEKWKELSHATHDTAITTPDVIAALVIDHMKTLNLEPKQQPPFRELLRELSAVDSKSGGHTAFFEFMNVTLLQQMHAETPETGAGIHLMNLDLSNLLGLNLALSGAEILNGSRRDVTPDGIARADKVLKILCHTICKGAKQATRNGGNFSFTRRGGDEFSIVFQGVSETNIQEAQDEILATVTRLIENFGLNDLLHPKYPHDTARRGVGIGCAFARYDPKGEDPFAYFERFDKKLDEGVERQKKRRASDLQQGFSKLEAKSTMHRRIQERGEAGGDEKIGMVTHMDSEELAKTEAAIYRSYRYLFGDEVHLQGEVNQLSPPSDEKNKFRWSSLEKRLRANAAITESGLTSLQRDFYWRLFDLTQARDTATGFKRESFAQTLESALASLSDRDPGYTLVALEMQNMTGLNQLLSHQGCDRMIARFTQAAAARLDHWGLAYRPGGRGDKFYILAPHNHAQEIFADIEILTQEIEKIVSDEYPHLQTLPNPRYPEKGQEGVRLIASAMQISLKALGPDPTARDVLDVLDAQLLKNKQHQWVFDGAALGINKQIGFHSRDVVGKKLQNATMNEIRR